ncbi:MAG: topoisomerase DNA-binding C4 zinc finger domain-containing protein, partial [Euryarchaeota archaeon]|nr:topoisomerase DNA-binding C4 zinc finger domain-containing protein [Euryarchaeota archaeon]
AKRILENSKSREALVKEVEKKEVRKPAPFPFDLGTLQTEAYRIFGFIPKKTQQIAQTLYEGGYISYPRTSSPKLPHAIGYERILRSLREAVEFRDYADAVLKKEMPKPREGPKSDPAHPAIYPTGILPKALSREAEELYKLIVHRFFAVFGEPLIREAVNVLCEIGREAFKFSGETTVEEGWNKLYPYIAFKEVEVPALKTGDILPVLKLYSSEKETQPPARFNPASLVKELEKRGLGTKATRAEIIDTLYQREYIRRTQIETTELGNAVIAALEENVPAIISEELTRRFEERLENIQNGRESKESVLEEAKKELSRIMNEFKQKEKLIGEKLVKALEEKNRRKYVVGVCKCGGDLRIIKSKATGKIFIGCSNYPKCSTSYPLPQREGVRTTDKKCSTCGLPMVSIPFRRKRFLSCIDMNCKSKSAKRF